MSNNQLPTANLSAIALAKADFQVTFGLGSCYLEVGSWPLVIGRSSFPSSLDIQFPHYRLQRTFLLSHPIISIPEPPVTSHLRGGAGIEINTILRGDPAGKFLSRLIVDECLSIGNSFALILRRNIIFRIDSLSG